MTDFSKLFTDPSADVYGPDATESAMWQQASTNPFAILHAIAARRGANNRREQYGEQLAAHDARAQAGASALSRQEYQQNIPLEYIKTKQLDPSFGMDLAGLRMENGEVDPRIRRQSHAFQAGQSADALKTHAEGVKAYGEAGYQLQDPGRLPDKYLNLSDLVEAPTLGEREQAARGRNDNLRPFTINTTIPHVDADGNMITTQDKYATKEERDAALRGGSVNIKPDKNKVKTNAGTKQPPATNVQPPASTKNNAPRYAPDQVAPVGPVSSMQFKALPPAQQQAIAQLRDKGYTTATGHTFKLVPSTLKHDGNGGVTVVIRATVDGQVYDETVQVGPDGRI